MHSTVLKKNRSVLKMVLFLIQLQLNFWTVRMEMSVKPQTLKHCTWPWRETRKNKRTRSKRNPEIIKRNGRHARKSTDTTLFYFLIDIEIFIPLQNTGAEL